MFFTSLLKAIFIGSLRWVLHSGLISIVYEEVEVRGLLGAVLQCWRCTLHECSIDTYEMQEGKTFVASVIRLKNVQLADLSRWGIVLNRSEQSWNFLNNT